MDNLVVVKNVGLAGTFSPWGKIQHSTHLSVGIWQVSTAGHGGIKLDRRANAQVPKQLRRRGGWYEEDIDWAIPAFFLKYGSEEHRTEAAEVLRRNYPDEYTAITGVPVALEESRVLRERKFNEENHDRFVVRSARSISDPNRPGLADRVRVWARRAKDGAEVEAILPLKRYQTRGEFGCVLLDDEIPKGA